MKDIRIKKKNYWRGIVRRGILGVARKRYWKKVELEKYEPIFCYVVYKKFHMMMSCDAIFPILSQIATSNHKHFKHYSDKLLIIILLYYQYLELILYKRYKK